jgi:hypothetical protein
MKKLVFRILLLIFILSPKISFGQQRDSIFFYKGEILIGDIKQVQLGILTIDDIEIRLTQIKMYRIRSLRSVQRFRIETSDKQVYYGSLLPSSKDGWCDIRISDSEQVSIPIMNISTMIYLKRNFFKRLNGNIGGGFSFSKSSSLGQFNLNASVKYFTKSFQNQLSLSTLGSIDSSKYSRDNETIELLSNYDLSSSWLAQGVLGYQRNLELSISRRFQEMLGVGNKLLLHDTWRLLLVSGVAFNQEKSTADVSSGTLVEIPVVLRFDFFKYTHPNIQITTTHAGFFSITQAGRFRYSGSTYFSLEIVHDFYVTLTLYSNYDNKPPVATASNTDYGIVTGISYKF